MNTHTSFFPEPPVLPSNSLSFIPLGGCGEFGNNFQVLHYNGEYLLIDCGFGFADERFPGIDIVLPSPSFLPHVTKQIKGLVITHAHEDHIGAIGALWPQLNCPIYATPLPARLIGNKLREWGLERRATVNVVPLESRHMIGGFDVEWINASHSVPETSMLFIRTPVANILHTADWRIDETPLVGQTTNLQRLAEIGAEGVDIILSESTNVDRDDVLASEKDLTEPLYNEFMKAPGKVLVSCVSSRLSRIHNVAVAAKKAGRSVGLLGRSMWRFYEAAYAEGYLRDLPPFLKPKELSGVPRNKLVVVATGSQGENGAALERMARRDHNDLEFYTGDTAIFSARRIPGNEKNILRMQGWLVQQGVQIINPEDAPIYVSGHGTADDMRRLYDIVKPKILIPVHGDVLNLLMHQELAKECGIETTVVPHNGDIITYDRTNGIGVDGHVETGLLAVDGDRVIPITDSKLFKQRQKIGEAGHLVVTLIVDADGSLINDPVIAGQGVVGTPDENQWLQSEIITLMEKTLNQLGRKGRLQKDVWQEALRVAIRHKLNDELGKKPVITVQLIVI